ncbi:hypothetical protein LJR289_000459 [Pseudoduganella sp. LjRoot289]|uniref:hypothetical protein n=1 Tax=Pseudoduganella sp. LjRoot289 TaxID=3342314 RepID=UPI003ECFA11C
MAKLFNPGPVLALVLVMAAAAIPAQALQFGQAPVGAPAVPQSHSIEQADARLAEVAKNRAAVEAEYSASEQVCYTKFFVNHCLDEAKERRRVALIGLRAIEVEANYFKRKFTVDQRDRELAERMKKDEEELARRVESAAATPPHVAREAGKPAPKAGMTQAQRQAAHDAKVQAQQAQEAAAAPQRAENVAAFEKKKAESEKRQADVAAKKAAKEEKLRKQQADAAAKAAKDAADAAAKAR